MSKSFLSLAGYAQGVILTDCVVVAGSQACPASNGVWSKCASRTDATDYYAPIVVAQPSDVTITNRTTISGELCRLPIINKCVLHIR